MNFFASELGLWRPKGRHRWIILPDFQNQCFEEVLIIILRREEMMVDEKNKPYKGGGGDLPIIAHFRVDLDRTKISMYLGLVRQSSLGVGKTHTDPHRRAHMHTSVPHEASLFKTHTHTYTTVKTYLWFPLLSFLAPLPSLSFFLPSSHPPFFSFSYSGWKLFFLY